MNITGISSGTESIYDKLAIYGSAATDATSLDASQSATVTGAGSDCSIDSVDFSKPGELFSQLQQLQQTDPEKFKEVCSNIAEELNEAAESSDGTDPMLSELASKFEEAAETGDVSGLKPPQGPPPMGPPPQSAEDAANAYSSNEINASQSDQMVNIAEIIENALNEAGISA